MWVMPSPIMLYLISFSIFVHSFWIFWYLHLMRFTVVVFAVVFAVFKGFPWRKVSSRNICHLFPEVSYPFYTMGSTFQTTPWCDITHIYVGIMMPYHITGKLTKRASISDHCCQSVLQSCSVNTKWPPRKILYSFLTSNRPFISYLNASLNSISFCLVRNGQLVCFLLNFVVCHFVSWFLRCAISRKSLLGIYVWILIAYIVLFC